jgi:hypothetical protein
MQIRKPLAERIMQSPVEERLRLLVDEIQRVLNESPLPRRHPDAAKQLQAKAEAAAALELFGRKNATFDENVSPGIVGTARCKTAAPRRICSRRVEAMGADNAALL